MLRGTQTERRRIRTLLYSGASEIQIRELATEGLWFAPFAEITVVEAPTPAELLREIALILEEV